MASVMHVGQQGVLCSSTAVVLALGIIRARCSPLPSCPFCSCPPPAGARCRAEGEQQGGGAEGEGGAFLGWEPNAVLQRRQPRVLCNPLLFPCLPLIPIGPHKPTHKPSHPHGHTQVLKPGVEDILTTDMSYVYLFSRFLEFIQPELSRLSLTGAWLVR